MKNNIFIILFLCFTANCFCQFKKVSYDTVTFTVSRRYYDSIMKPRNEIYLTYDGNKCCNVDSGRLIIYGDTTLAIKNLFKKYYEALEQLEQDETTLWKIYQMTNKK